MGLLARIRKALAGSTIPEQVFRDQYREFQRLLEANDTALERMAALSELLARREPFTYGAAARLVAEILENTRQMVASLVRLSGGRYAVLHQRLAEIAREQRWALPGGTMEPCDSPSRETGANAISPRPASSPAPPSAPGPPHTIQLDRVDARHLALVGGKMARLGEVKNVLRLPVPAGFCITRRCFDDALATTGIRSQVASLTSHLDLQDAAGLQATCAEVQSLLASAPVPPAVEAAVLGAYDEMCSQLGRECRVAVRSSAVGEDDSRHSFAGLHHTALNVPRDGLLDACWEVLISKYSPQSVVYRILNGLRAEDMPMNVGCLPMLKPRVSGTLFTADPRGERTGIIIHAVRGLGSLLVEGALVPQEFVVAPGRTGAITGFRPGNQDYALAPRDGEGLERTAIAGEQRRLPSLTPAEAARLAAHAATIEEHFGTPQDIEWAITEEGEIFILQTRPLLVRREEQSASSRNPPPEAGDAVLARGGEIGCAGVGCGPAFIATHERLLVDFPEGGVLVTRQTSPVFARVLHRAAAVLTEVGSPTGHLAIIARELRVPMLLNVPGASGKLQAGALVTVDAHRGIVYAGRIEGLLPANDQRASRTSFSTSPVFQMVSAAAAELLPLKLIDPHATAFAPQNCRTAHDVTRFCHEMAIREMFDANKSGPRRRMSRVRRLAFTVPLETFVIDLGGGLATGVGQETIQPEEIASVPFRALIAGMSTPGLQWSGAVPIELRGFADLVINSMMDTERVSAELGSDAYALVSDRYVNYSARMGYHFASLDAYASSSLHRNYISYRFKGGAAGSARRVRRARFIAHVLRHWGFSVAQQADRLDATIRKLSEPDILALLRELGRLLGAVRNADVSMYSDELIEIYAEAFLAGACSPVEAVRGKLRGSS